MLLPINSKPPKLIWIVAVLLVIVQQGAFVSIPLIVTGVTPREIQNPFNTAGIAISMICIGICCFPWLRQVAYLTLENRFSLLFMFLVIVSAAWSIHPDLTIRRGLGYVLTIIIAAYLSLRFSVVDRMKVLSWGFAISAISCLAFVAAFPQYGIMQHGDLTGTWRGVFSHKNTLGLVMAVAVFTELFVLVASKGRPRWRFALLSTYFALVVLSRSATAFVLSSAFLAGTGAYLLWQRDRLLGVGISVMAVFLIFAVFIIFWSDPKFAFGILGKDTSLTGRTNLWASVIPLIKKRPVLGWGYRAMWQANDTSAVVIDQIAEWGAVHSHNAFLEITLQLGLVGAAVLLVIIVSALGRSLRCKSGIIPLGFFSLMFFMGAILGGLTEETLAQNQNIAWIVFNVLSFGCGIGLASRRETGVVNVRRHRDLLC